jgi:hypothetical protein
MLLRTYQLAQVQTISYDSEYGGCKSWIDLAEPISINGAVPVLDEAKYTQMVLEITGVIGNNKNFYAPSL